MNLQIGCKVVKYTYVNAFVSLANSILWARESGKNELGPFCRSKRFVSVSFIAKRPSETKIFIVLSCS